MGGKLGYITGPLQIAAGAASEYFAPGNPFGIPLITGGIGQAAGTAAGHPMLGELGGAALGGLGEGFMGLGPLGSTLGGGSIQSGLQGTGIGNFFGVPQTAAQAAAAPAASTQQQIQNLATAGFPGATQMAQEGAGTLPAGFPVTGASAAAGATSPTPSSADTSWYDTPGAKFALDAAGKVMPQAQTATPPAFKPPIQQAPVAAKGQAPATSITPTVTQVPRSTRSQTPISAAPSVPGRGPSLQQALTMQQYLQQLQEMGLPMGLPLTGT